jgi:transposase
MGHVTQAHFLSRPSRDDALIARAAFRKGNLYMRLRDELGTLYTDEDFAHLFPSRGQPALPAWRLALVTVMQFLENLPDRQAADAVRARIDWKYALGLELTDPGFDYSVLSEFRNRLIQGKAEHLLLDRMLAHFQDKGLVKARGRQRTDSTHVLAAIRLMNRLELVAETLRATLNDLAQIAPDWLGAVAPPAWYARYGRRIEPSRLPKSEAARMDFAQQVGHDGFVLLDALAGPSAPTELTRLPTWKRWGRSGSGTMSARPRAKPGGAPGRERGEEYKEPITVTQGTVLAAVAYTNDLAASAPVLAAFRIGKPGAASKTIRTFHIGNSLTDTVDGWLRPAAESAGKSLDFHRFTIPGAPTDWLWNHPGTGFGDSHYPQAFFALTPLDHLFTQPFAGHGRDVANEADYSGRFYRLARRHSPGVQMWLYVSGRAKPSTTAGRRRAARTWRPAN